MCSPICAGSALVYRGAIPKLAGPVSTQHTNSVGVDATGMVGAQFKDTPLIPRTFTGDALSWWSRRPSWPYQFAPQHQSVLSDRRPQV